MHCTSPLRLFASLLVSLGGIQTWAADPAVSAGRDHSVYLTADGTALVAGFYYTNPGKLNKGDGRTPVPVLTGVKAVSAGVDHTLFLKDDGSVWAEGSNRTGEVGDGTTLIRPEPVKVLEGVRAISAGGFHSFFLKMDNSLWACGRNFDGQLADGTKIDRRTPVKVMENVAAVSGGWFLSLFLKMDGTVLAMGDNSSGQLGNGSNQDPVAPVTVPITGVSAVVAGGDHSLFLQTDGTVWATGWNSSGQLGDGTTKSRNTPVQVMTGVKAITASEKHTLFLGTDGIVRATGNNELGKLGDGTTLNRSMPVQGMTGIQAISAGPKFSLFVKIDGSVFAAGQVNGEITPTPVMIHLTPDSSTEWRQENFGVDAGNPDIAGWGADPDGDGVENLLERAFNLKPGQAGPSVLTPETGVAGLPFVTLSQSLVEANALVVQYVRFKASINAGLVYSPEFSSAPDAEWIPYGGAETVESIDEFWQRVTVKNILQPSIERRFARVRVTASP